MILKLGGIMGGIIRAVFIWLSEAGYFEQCNNFRIP
jgi:hypothetical protein